MTVKDVKRMMLVCMVAVGTIVSGASFRLHAQSGDSTEVRRKVKSLAKPQYPELAKKLNLTGVVKIEVTIGADGKVKRTRLVGGHPVFAAEAERAAMESEFEPGPKETTEIIEFKFNGQ
jgi:TonB family protein